jgi:hypothetical protein
MRVFRAAACAFVLTASAACSGHWFAPSGGAIGSPSYGIVTQTWSPELAAWSADLGTGWVRLDVNWFEVEPSRGVFNWSAHDAHVDDARSRGFRVYATLAYTPAWAGPCLYCMPSDVADWRAFVAAAMRHYGTSGIVYGVWNEPNLGFLDDTDDGERYAQLFVAANEARAAVDRRAVLAGPETSHHALPVYLPAVMDRIGQQMTPSDVVSVHYYPDAPLPVAAYMQAVSGEAHGHHVWLTETGFGSCDDQAQRAYFDRTLSTFDAEGRTWWPVLFAYVLYNGSPCGDALIAPSGARRPAYTALQSFIAAHR